MIGPSLNNRALPTVNSSTSVRRRKWRETKDSMAKIGVATGGMSVIFAIVLIFFYLLYVVMPLFHGAEIETVAEFQLENNAVTHLTLNEYNDVALSLNKQGQIRFFSAENGQTILEPQLPLSSARVSSFAAGASSTGVFAYGFADGQILVFKQAYEISYLNDIRKITPRIEFPIGEQTIQLDVNAQPLNLLSVQSNVERTTIAAVTDDKHLVIYSLIREESFLDENEYKIEKLRSEIDLTSTAQAKHLAIDIDQDELYLIDVDGFISYYDIQDVANPKLVQKVRVVPQNVEVTSLAFLAGGISILLGRSDGQIDQCVPDPG